MADFQHVTWVKLSGELIVVRGRVTAADEDLAAEAVIRDLEERLGFSPDRDRVVSLYLAELEAVEYELLQ